MIQPRTGLWVSARPCSLTRAWLQAWAFGGNEYQQATGEENEEGPGHDVVTPQPCLSGIRVVQLAAGGMHSVALTDAGEVRMCADIRISINMLRPAIRYCAYASCCTPWC